MRLAVQAEQRSDYDRAVVEYTNALRDDPDNRTARMSLDRVRMRSPDRARAPAASFLQAVVTMTFEPDKIESAVRTLNRPHDVLGFAHVFLNLRISAVRIVDARLTARAVRRNSS